MSRFDPAPLWQAFHERGDQRALEQLILWHVPYVHLTVRRVVPHVPAAIDRDDLEAEGRVALVKAVDRFDPARGLPFRTLLITSIRFRLREYLRQEDWVPRSIWDARRRLAQVEAAAGGDDRAVAERLRLDSDGLTCLRGRLREIAVCSLEGTGSGGDGEHDPLADVLVDPAPLPFEQVTSRAEARLARRLARALPGREGEIVRRHYWQEQSLAEIAAALGLSVTRVKQVHAQGLDRLRCLARSRGEGADAR